MLNVSRCFVLILGFNFMTLCAATSDAAAFEQTSTSDGHVQHFNNWMDAATVYFESIDSFFAYCDLEGEEKDTSLEWLVYFCDLGYGEHWQNSLFVHAARSGRSDLLPYLFDWYSHQYISILYSAVRAHAIDIELIKNLVGGLSEEKFKPHDQKKLVTVAIGVNSLPVVDVLINKFPCLVNNIFKNNALKSMLDGHKYEFIVYFLNKGAEICTSYEEEKVLIDFLKSSESHELATMISNTTDKNKWNELFFHAILPVSNHVLNIFVQNGVDVNAQVRGYRFLSRAAWFNTSFAKDLLALDDIDVNAINDGAPDGFLRGSTPLTSLVTRALCCANTADDVLAFVSHPRIKSNINTADRSRKTPLMIALESKEDNAFNVLKALLESGSITITLEDFQRDFRLDDENRPYQNRLVLLFLHLRPDQRDAARSFLNEALPVKYRPIVTKALNEAVMEEAEERLSLVRGARVSPVERAPRPAPGV
jgi:hypothetical protein